VPDHGVSNPVHLLAIPVKPWRDLVVSGAAQLRALDGLPPSGLPNQSRFPAYLSVDACLSKDVKVSDKYTLRFSIVGSNLTNHFNPISVHANTADPLYGVFFGESRRRYTADFDVIF
jgi:hypothetical protein